MSVGIDISLPRTFFDLHIDAVRMKLSGCTIFSSKDEVRGQKLED